jgi:hypothetical protein
MSCSREGYDLFHKPGRYHFFRDLKRGRFNHLMWCDTFGQVLCKIIRHNVYNAADDSSDYEPACTRCHKFLPGARYVQQERDQTYKG